MPSDLAFDIDAALQGAKLHQLRHRSGDLPDTVAEGHIRELFELCCAIDPDDGVDDEGRPLPLPVLDDRRYLQLAQSDRLTGNFSYPGKTQGRNLHLHAFHDRSAILVEEIGSGYAMLPVALFFSGLDTQEQAEVRSDLLLYCDAMRRLPRATLHKEGYDLKSAEPGRVIPHWARCNSRDRRANDPTLQAFRQLAQYFALRAASVFGADRYDVELKGRRILRDGSLTDLRIEIMPGSRIIRAEMRAVEEEFESILNTDRFAEGASRQILQDRISGNVGSTLRNRSLAVASFSLPHVSAHDIIQATSQIDPWRHPS